MPWEAVHVWWGDDRYVPVDHPESNVKAFDDIMLGIAGGEEGTAGGRGLALPIPADNVHPFPTAEAIAETRGAAWCATTLGDTLRAAGLDEVGGWPVFDLILLGIGPDGHLLSAFPGSAALDSPDLALAVPAPTHIGPHIERVTLNPAVIGVAREVLVVVHGADKAAGVARHLRAGARPASVAGPARPARRGDLDPRRGGGRRAPALTVADQPSRHVIVGGRDADRAVQLGDGPPLDPRPRRDRRPHDVPGRRAAARAATFRLHAIDRRGRGRLG